MPFMKRLKRVGPKQEPWGAPNSILFEEENSADV